MRQKVFGCPRTIIGARQFCAIRSYLSTTGKHGMEFFEALVMLNEGKSLDARPKLITSQPIVGS